MKTKNSNPGRDDLSMRLSSFFFRHPKAILAALLIPPLLWLGVFYLGSLLILVINSFYTVDDFSGVVDNQIRVVDFAITFATFINTDDNVNVVFCSSFANASDFVSFGGY